MLFVIKLWMNFSCFTQKGQGAPAREPVIKEDEQKAMMAYYYRKQEELKVWRFLLPFFCFVVKRNLFLLFEKKMALMCFRLLFSGMRLLNYFLFFRNWRLKAKTPTWTHSGQTVLLCDVSFMVCQTYSLNLARNYDCWKLMVGSSDGNANKSCE